MCSLVTPQVQERVATASVPFMASHGSKTLRKIFNEKWSSYTRLVLTTRMPNFNASITELMFLRIQLNMYILYITDKIRNTAENIIYIIRVKAIRLSKFHLMSAIKLVDRCDFPNLFGVKRSAHQIAFKG